MTSALPYVSVTHRHATGADTLDPQRLAEKEVRLAEVLPFEKAFFERHEFPLHALQYRPRELATGNMDHAPIPRCNKSVLPELRDAGLDLVSTMFVFDWDLPKVNGSKQPWNPDLMQMYEAEEATVEDFFPYLTLHHTTLHGSRLVFVLEEPIPVDVSESYYNGMVALFHSRGFHVDPDCSDWTRAFVLPRVFKDGVYTDEQDSFRFDWHPEARFDPRAHITPATRSGMVSRISRVDVNLPRPTERMTAFDVESTQWGKAAKKTLRGTVAWDIIFGNHLLARAGERDSRIQTITGSVSARLYWDKANHFQPEHVYHLLYEPVCSLEPDAKEPYKDWHDVMWSAVQRYWSAEATEDKRREVEATVTEGKKEDAQEILLAGMKKWCTRPELRCELAWDWAKRHLLAGLGGSFYLIRPDGFFSDLNVNQTTLVPACRELLGDVIETKSFKIVGNTIVERWKTAQELINEHSFPIASLEARCTGLGGTHVRGLGTSSAALLLDVYQRRDILPEKHPLVDLWLRLLAGESYPRLAAWIAMAIAVEEGPMPVLCFSAPPGVGKQMLVRGILENFNTETFSDHNVFSQFRESLLESPLIVINEGAPLGGHSYNSPSETIRKIAGGDPIIVERKFKPPVVLHAHPRVLFTANNAGLVDLLAGRQDLSQWDREAIAEKVMFAVGTSDAAQWLASAGGRGLTAAPGARWVGGSEFIVAKHFRWLYEQRHELAEAAGGSGRYLVTGGNDEETIDLLRSRTGASGVVLKLIAEAINQQAQHLPCYVDVERQAVWLTGRALLDMSETRQLPVTLTSNNVSKVLESVGRKDVREDLSRRYGLAPHARWYKIQMTELARLFGLESIECKKLFEVLKHG